MALTGAGALYLGQNLNLSGTNHIQLGWDVSREVNAGKIGYQLFTAGAVDFLGAGTSTRVVKIWDDLYVAGNVRLSRGTGTGYIYSDTGPI